MLMDDLDELRAWLIALRTPGLGPGGLRERLDAAGGDIRVALAQLRRHAAPLGELARAWLARPDEVQLAADLAWLAEPEHRLLRCTEADFPPQLENIPQPPAVLFVVGDASLLLYPQVAIVGARGASAAGLAHARAFALALVDAGFAITSGMADGIDGAAHAAALDAGAKTLAVVGTGADRVYPRKHHALARRIAAHGVLVSEFPPGTPARPDHFPRRNRIISGLALGTLVIEAGLRSGSLITARLAAEQGREVFALPGSIHHPLARGCHRLIRDGARLVESAAEIVETLTPAARMLGGELAARLNAAGGETLGSAQVEGDDDSARAHDGECGDSEYQRLLAELGHAPTTLDELAQRTGQSAAALSAMLLMLELEARVETLPGNRYQRLPDG
ncbi:MULTISPECIES: DNA-processing protein DprA [unclassified Rhodanobacter]|uniref:DNA-processing protein DprA n=1 Tax=unclassified Rhodanobacter TaxID=2621553 RepID=UPI001BDF4D82|nr:MULTISPECIES: DNA-processing protein DprA [unclassified Rhodanobacter]MBT2143921.1 DNA-processing protein DprA [Rhodanobacter sp. LX-99]MBT2147005.1 DNA-processing protein DprA [Rhodanobacter sp. LX-100]